MYVIGLEEHFATPDFLAGPGRSLTAHAEAMRDHPAVAAGLTRLIEDLSDIGERRILAMDEAGLDMQVLSLTAPGIEQLDRDEAVKLARATNDLLAEAVAKHPDRLAGFAALPTAVPEAAAEELRRAVEELGLKGALINGHVRGRYLDDAFFWPVFEAASALDVPIYLHPTLPTAEMAAKFGGNYSREVAGALSTAAWGWHIDTAFHLLRIVLSGVFDRHPGLQLVVGHMGEALPFMLPRLELAMARQVTRLEREIGDYLRQNVHYTFGSFNWTSAFLDLVMQVGVGRIMFSTDHPYGSMAQARDFLARLPVSPADRERIANGNARALLRL